MRPVLFHIGSLPVYSYIVFVNLAFVACLVYGLLEGKREKLNPVYVIDASLVIFVACLAGARLLFCVVDYQRYLKAPLDVFKIWQGGLVYYGGLILACAAAAGYIKLRHEPLKKWADFLAPVAMLCLVFGRIGCFLNGCCYGTFAPDLPWGVIYPVSHQALGLFQVKVHPSPIYESLATLAVFIFLNILLRRDHRPGSVFWVMVLCYSIVRFTLEFWRGDPRGFVMGTWLSTSQLISIISAVMAVAGLLILRRSPIEQGTAP